MRWAAGLLGAALVAAPAVLAAQGSTGEARILAVAGWAPRAHDAHPGPDMFGPPGGRTLPGLVASFSFTTGRFSAGPEAMILRGSDRKMYGLGASGRVRVSGGTLRP